MAKQVTVYLKPSEGVLYPPITISGVTDLYVADNCLTVERNNSEWLQYGFPLAEVKYYASTEY